MLEHLKLNIPECEFIDLRYCDIDWVKFNNNCVKYYNKWKHITTNISIKTYKQNAEPIDQIKNTFGGYTFYEDSNDVFLRIKEIAEQLTIPYENLTAETAYCWFNTDIYEEFPIIANVISQIEKNTNIEFGQIKLRYVGPRNVEIIHTDYGNVRYHMPIVTNDNVFFVSNDKIFHMRNNSKLYILNTNEPHTIVNAGGTVGRLHFIATPKNTEHEFNYNNFLNTAKLYVNHAEKLLENINFADMQLNLNVYKDLRNKISTIKNLLSV